MNRKITFGLFFIALPNLLLHVIGSSNLMCFLQGFGIGLGSALLIAGIIEKRKEEKQ